VIVGDVWGAVGGIGAVVAAVAAVVAIYFARATVGEAKEARNDSIAAHRELMALQRAGLDYQRLAERVSLAARIAEILAHVVDLAREEFRISGDGNPVTTQGYRTLPAVLTGLGAVLTGFEALGGPELEAAHQLETSTGEPPSVVLSRAVSATQQLSALARSGQFKLPGEG